jgi:hypothetical protein
VSNISTNDFIKALVVIGASILVIRLIFNYAETAQDLNYRIEDLERKYSLFKNKYELERFPKETKIDGSIELVDIYGDTITISSIIEEGQTLVFRYSYLGCNDCVVDILGKLKDMQAHFTIGLPIVLITYSEKFRDLLLENRTHDITFPIYHLPRNDLIDNKIDQLNSPYFFILDGELCCHDFFIPDIELNDHSDSYLSYVRKKYFDLL